MTGRKRSREINKSTFCFQMEKMKQNNAYAKLKMGDDGVQKMKKKVAYAFQDKMAIKII